MKRGHRPDLSGDTTEEVTKRRIEGLRRVAGGLEGKAFQPWELPEQRCHMSRKGEDTEETE